MVAILLFIVVFLSLATTESNSCNASTPPELPRIYLNTAYAPPPNPTRYTPQSSSDFQNALNACKLGDVIELQAGSIYNGPFRLPNKNSGTGWVYITSSALSSLPSACTRVSPSDAPNMPSIVVAAGAGAAIQTVPRAHHYRFVGIEFKPLPGNYVYNIVQIGGTENAESALPNNIVLDRCYIHGDSVAGSRRGVMMNGASVAVIDSYVSDFKETGADSQALTAWSTTGPIKIVNNHLEGAGENLMFGGTDPTIPNAVPSDIEIRCNDFFKPLEWMQQSWVVKNLLEFKNAQRVIVEGNHFENNWPSGQSGFALLLTPWSVVQDITIRRNVFVNIAQGINMLGQDAPNISQRTNRVLIQDNVLKAVQMTGSDGRMFELLDDPMNVQIDHNTAFCPVAYMVSDGSPKTDSFAFTNNIVSQGAYGFIGTGTANAMKTLAMYYNDNWTITNNAIIGGSAINYPPGSFFPQTVAAVGFVDTSAENFRLTPTSPYQKAGTDDRDLGADIDAINLASTYSCGQFSNSVKTDLQEGSDPVFPSPADKQITIQAGGSDETPLTLTIVDNLGRALHSTRVIGKSKVIDVTNLPNGVYTVLIQGARTVKISRFAVRH